MSEDSFEYPPWPLYVVMTDEQMAKQNSLMKDGWQYKDMPMSDPILDKLHRLIEDHQDSNWDSDTVGCSAADLENKLRALLAEVAIETEMLIRHSVWRPEDFSREQVIRQAYQRFGVEQSDA